MEQSSSEVIPKRTFTHNVTLSNENEEEDLEMNETTSNQSQGKVSQKWHEYDTLSKQFS